VNAATLARRDGLGPSEAAGRGPSGRATGRWTIVHVITGLGTGGAETMLHKLLSATDRSRFDPSVVSLLGGGATAELIRRLGITVRSLGMQRGVPDARGLVRLARLLAADRPHLLQTWLMHADLVGGIAASAVGVPVVWNIRHSVLDRAATSSLTRVTERTCALLSRWLPRKVVCCSVASSRQAKRVGYDASKMLVIPNGFDVSAFRPDVAARASVRAELGVRHDATLVGLVARWDANKDHATFLRSAARVHAARPDVHFLMCGAEVVPANAALAREVEDGGLGGVIHLLGARTDMPRLQSALDVACSSSTGEGFPNVIGEAMACGVPCVVTDVGDSAHVVGDTGRVVPARDPGALASALLDLVGLGEVTRRSLGARARERVQAKYALAPIARRYEALWERLIVGRGR